MFVFPFYGIFPGIRSEIAWLANDGMGELSPFLLLLIVIRFGSEISSMIMKKNKKDGMDIEQKFSLREMYPIYS